MFVCLHHIIFNSNEPVILWLLVLMNKVPASGTFVVWSEGNCFSEGLLSCLFPVTGGNRSRGLWRWPNGSPLYRCGIKTLVRNKSKQNTIYLNKRAKISLKQWELTWSDGISPRLTPSRTLPGNSSSTPSSVFQRGKKEVCQQLPAQIHS